MAEPEFSIYLKPYNAVCIDIAKVASSSLKAVFAELLGLDLDAAGGNPHEVTFERPPTFDAPGDRLHPGLYTFAFVRNPWDRLVSCYRDKICGEVSDFTAFSEKGIAHCLARFEAFAAGMSFDEFVRTVASIPDQAADEHFRSQYCFVTNSLGDVAVDFVGRYENLEADFRIVAQEIGLPATISLPRLQAAAREDHYAAYYTGELQKIVANRFERDVDLFKYQF